MDQRENPDHTGIKLDVLAGISADLDARSELKEIFGDPVSAGLVAVADDNDLRIEITPDVEITKEQADTFLQILGEVIDTYSQ